MERFAPFVLETASDLLSNQRTIPSLSLIAFFCCRSQVVLDCDGAAPPPHGPEIRDTTGGWQEPPGVVFVGSVKLFFFRALGKTEGQWRAETSEYDCSFKVGG